MSGVLAGAGVVVSGAGVVSAGAGVLSAGAGVLSAPGALFRLRRTGATTFIVGCGGQNAEAPLLFYYAADRGAWSQERSY